MVTEGAVAAVMSAHVGFAETDVALATRRFGQA